MMKPELVAAEPRALPRIEYARLAPADLAAPLPADVLAAIAFGRAPTPPRASAAPPSDPRLIRVGLDPLGSDDTVELWRAEGPVSTGSAGGIRFAADDTHLAGRLDLDEHDHGGLASAAEWAYATILRFQARSHHPHLLRMWNYFDAINDGEGDEERYKQFCIGRAAGFAAAARHRTTSLLRFPAERLGADRSGMSGIPAEHHSMPGDRFPAATAIGRRDGSRILQIYWLAARAPGTALENPRQVSAYRYPREYGPASPTFSRAMLVPPGLLLVSGTASIVGHASRHPGSLQDQLEETLANLTSVIERAAAIEPALSRRLSARTRLKIYLRDRASAPAVAARLAERLPPGTRCLMLEADICREELLLEIDCVHA